MPALHIFVHDNRRPAKARVRDSRYWEVRVKFKNGNVGTYVKTTEQEAKSFYQQQMANSNVDDVVVDPPDRVRAPSWADAGDVRIVYNKLLGGWYIVRGPHQTPIGGRFESKEAAQAHLNRNKDSARDGLGDPDPVVYKTYTITQNGKSFIVHKGGHWITTQFSLAKAKEQIDMVADRTKDATAATSSLLAHIKGQMNSKIYQEALRLYNSQGKPAVIEYMMRFYNDDYKAIRREEFQRLN